jgi:hypothetical protein
MRQTARNFKKSNTLTVNIDFWFKPEIVTGKYNTRTGISNVKKALVRLYFLVGVASEVRVEKISKNIEFLLLKEI